jgi:hypothetical protein
MPNTSLTLQPKESLEGNKGHYFPLGIGRTGSCMKHGYIHAIDVAPVIL